MESDVVFRKPVITGKLVNAAVQTPRDGPSVLFKVKEECDKG